MKVKFLKDYRYPGGGYSNKGDVQTFEDAEFAKWAIDNGFAEEVKESGWWKPKPDEKYYFLGSIGEIGAIPWYNDKLDKYRYSVGNMFKTDGAAERYRDYLKAIATVRQDEGVLTPEKVRETLNQDGTVYTVGTNATALSVKHFYNASAGAVYFDTVYHANTSIGNHLDEWRIISSYDWSRE